MVFKKGKYKHGEDETNLEYKEKIKTINADELAIMFENKAKIDLYGYMDRFDKIKAIEGEGFFSKLNTSVNKKQIEELTVELFCSISEDLGLKVEETFKTKNPNIIIDLKENSKKFFSSCERMQINSEIKFPEEFLKDIKINNPELYEQIEEINKEKSMIQISVSLNGYLGDLYNLVHEMTHFVVPTNNSTTRILDEVAPQCMERILDEFLLELPEEELKKYNFDKRDLRKDIRARRIISFVSRYNATKDYNQGRLKGKDMSEKEKETLKYFLAQLFQSQFTKYDKKEKKKKILEFIEYNKDDDFESACKSLGVDWNKKIMRQIYIDNMINDIKIELENGIKGKNTGTTDSQNNKNMCKEDEDILTM